MLKLILIYFIFQTIYVILNTVKTILTIKSTKAIASLASAITYAVYVFVLIYTVADFSIWVKAGLTAITNLVGTYVSILLLEKFRKDKLWEITATMKANIFALKSDLSNLQVGYNIQATHRENEYIVHLYSETKEQSIQIKAVLQKYNAKYIIHEDGVRL